MSELTAKDRKKLRALAHNLEPLVLVGKNGVTENLLREIQTALQAHELIKVKFVDHKEERVEISEDIATKVSCSLVGLVGNTTILYLPNPERDKRRISI